MINIEVLTGPPGCGKSTVMRAEAIAQPGHYLFAYPTTKLIAEQAAAFRAEMSPGSLIIEAHSEMPGSIVVQKRLDAAQKQVAESGRRHVIILTTHASLMNRDMSGFAGWHFRIDEAPASIQNGVERSPVLRDFLGQHFSLDPVGDESWSQVNLTDPKAARSWREGDGLTKAQAELLNQASQASRLFVDVRSWAEKTFQWVSVWSPHVLEGLAASVKIAGASYLTSIGALVSRTRVNFAERVISMPRRGMPTIRVHYFTQGHEGSTALWKTSRGRSFIVKLCDYLVANEPNLGFWSANDVVANLLEHRVPGEKIDPKVAGQNEYRDLTRCAFIYSARQTPDDAPLKALFGITDEEIQIARQDEDVLQFVMRGAVRMGDYAGPYDIYLYSRSQAERLEAQLVGSGVGTVELVPVEAAGFMYATRPSGQPMTEKPDKVVSKTGRFVSRKSAETTARRHKKAAAQGRLPGKAGRPKKAK